MRGPRKATSRTSITRVSDDRVAATRDDVAREEPLEIRVSAPDQNAGEEGSSVAVTMRTPGHDFELAVGFLHGERLITSRRSVLEVRYCTGPDVQEYNVVTVALRAGTAFELKSMERNFYTTSSCGVCGKASIDQVEAMVPECVDAPTELLSGELVRELPERLRDAQSLFARTGGAHAAGVFDWSGNPLWVREDVGRHNAVDKVVGAAFMESALPLSNHVLVVSGRASFELVQKAGAAGIPALVAVGAPSSLAVDLAQRLNMILIGFAKPTGFNIYSGAERVSHAENVASVR